MDWAAWHEHYDDPASPLSARLRCVQAHLADAIDRAPPGRISLVSLCAGQGRDVIGVLPDHPRRDDVRAVLVESDERNAGPARQAAAARGLTQVEVRVADASLVASFADALPADVLLLCGIFGNISDHDIERTAQAAPALCRADLHLPRAHVNYRRCQVAQTGWIRPSPTSRGCTTTTSAARTTSRPIG